MNNIASLLISPAAERIAEIHNLLLDENKVLKLLPADTYKQLTHDEIRYFCWEQGLYHLPTEEMITFLEGFIGDQSAIEVAAGMGNIGRFLNIPMTDSKLHNTPDIAKVYKDFNQPICKYSDQVITMDGNTAVETYKPDITIGAWVTERPRNVHGIDELKLIQHTGIYVIFGNELIHDDKPLAKIVKPSKLKFPWLISKGYYPEKNCIYVFNGYK